MTQLISTTPSPLAKLREQDLSPVAYLGTPRAYNYTHIHIDRRHIFSFATRGPDGEDGTMVKQMAILWYRDGQKTFTLQYYTTAGDAQIVKELPLDKLPEAVADLRAAGFEA